MSTFRLLALGIFLLGASLARAGNSDYPVGAGDLLQISVSGYPELNVSERVSESGNISFPYLNSVAVGGKSSGEIEALIARKLVEGAIIRRPQVSALVVEFQSQMVSVMGEVNKPGQYPLITGRHLVDVLAAAGGPIVSPTAAAYGVASDQATLEHRDGSSTKIDLAALFAGDPRQNVAVAGGDTLFVPRAAQFYVYGEVQKAGIYPLQHQMTVAQAISAGGGLTAKGSDRRILLKRRDPQGVEQQMTVSSADLVQPDDVLLVKQRLF
jgi:polysaccharide export outer membrane protein